MFLQSLNSVLVLVLLASGLVHGAQPYFFLASVASFRILPEYLLGLTVLIPYLQIAIAVCLITHVAERTAIIFAALLFFIFSVAQVVVILRGERLSCGCFGYSNAEIGLTTLAIPLLCMFICWVLSGSFSARKPRNEKNGEGPEV